jgi:hypothetical protein
MSRLKRSGAVDAAPSVASVDARKASAASTKPERESVTSRHTSQRQMLRRMWMSDSLIALILRREGAQSRAARKGNALYPNRGLAEAFGGSSLASLLVARLHIDADHSRRHAGQLLSL